MIKFVKNDFFIYCKEARIESHRSFYGSFSLGPFEAGQSITIANALRRTLLSELKGLAITSAEIEGAFHEYATLPGVRDSILDILLNLKDIVLKSINYGNKKRGTSYTATFKNEQLGYLKSKGPGIVTASDLKLPPGIQCVDPDQYIATLSEEGILNIKFHINEGANANTDQSLSHNKPKSPAASFAYPSDSSIKLEVKKLEGADRLGASSIAAPATRTSGVNVAKKIASSNPNILGGNGMDGQSPYYGFTIIPPQVWQSPSSKLHTKDSFLKEIKNQASPNVVFSTVPVDVKTYKNLNLNAKPVPPNNNVYMDGLTKTINKLFFSPRPSKLRLSNFRSASLDTLALTNNKEQKKKKSLWPWLSKENEQKKIDIGSLSYGYNNSSNQINGIKMGGEVNIKRLWLKKIKAIQASYVHKINRQKKAFSLNKINKTVLKELGNLIKKKNSDLKKKIPYNEAIIALSTPLAIQQSFMPVNKVNYIIEINEQSVIAKDSLGNVNNNIGTVNNNYNTNISNNSIKLPFQVIGFANNLTVKKTPSSKANFEQMTRSLLFGLQAKAYQTNQSKGVGKLGLPSTIDVGAPNKVCTAKSQRTSASSCNVTSNGLTNVEAAYYKNKQAIYKITPFNKQASPAFFSVKKKQAWQIEPKALLKKSHIVLMKASCLRTFSSSSQVNYIKAPLNYHYVKGPKENTKKFTRGTLLSNYPHIKSTLSVLQTSLKNNIVLEIWTNGSIHPRQALYDACKNLLSIFSKLEKARFTRAIFQSEKTYEKLGLSLISKGTTSMAKGPGPKPWWKSNLIKQSLIKNEWQTSNGSLPFSVVNKLNQTPSLILWGKAYTTFKAPSALLGQRSSQPVLSAWVGSQAQLPTSRKLAKRKEAAEQIISKTDRYCLPPLEIAGYPSVFIKKNINRQIITISLLAALSIKLKNQKVLKNIRFCFTSSMFRMNSVYGPKKGSKIQAQQEFNIASSGQKTRSTQKKQQSFFYESWAILSSYPKINNFIKQNLNQIEGRNNSVNRVSKSHPLAALKVNFNALHNTCFAGAEMPTRLSLSGLDKGIFNSKQFSFISLLKSYKSYKEIAFKYNYLDPFKSKKRFKNTAQLLDYLGVAKKNYYAWLDLEKKKKAPLRNNSQFSFAPIWGVMFNKNKQFFLAMPKNHQIAFFQNKTIKKDFLTHQRSSFARSAALGNQPKQGVIKGSYKNGFYLSKLANTRSKNNPLYPSLIKRVWEPKEELFKYWFAQPFGEARMGLVAWVGSQAQQPTPLFTKAKKMAPPCLEWEPTKAKGAASLERKERKERKEENSKGMSNYKTLASSILSLSVGAPSSLPKADASLVVNTQLCLANTLKANQVPLWREAKMIKVLGSEAYPSSKSAASWEKKGSIIIKNLKKIDVFLKQKQINWNIKMSLTDYNILKTKPEFVDIGKLNISLRPYTCLKRANINTLGELLKKSKEELLALKNFGKQSLKEVEENLKQLGLSLKS
nr:RNA polymerase alpha subunit [Chloromonas rosae]